MRVERADVQGLVVSGYAALPASALLFVRFDEGDPHGWLRRLLPRVSSAARSERLEPHRVNVAFSYRGLERLGLSPASLSGFARAFRQGMAHPERSRALGDVGEDAPEHWELGNERRPVDALVLVYARTSPELELRLDELTDSLEQYELDWDEERTYLRPDLREHFGFRAAVSAPQFRGGLSRGRGRGKLPAGELLLGYAGVDRRRAPSPTAPFRRSTRDARLRGRREVDLGHNGTYLVLRKLEQRVAGFWGCLEDQVRRTHGVFGDATALAARLLGRWPDGASLVRHPQGPPASGGAGADDFAYAEDPRGLGCPLGAHVRRANPRDQPGTAAALHQLVRRGRLYGPAVTTRAADDGARRGLMFVALNADLERQFEYVQRNWLNEPKLFGLRGERDPLLGSDDGSSRVFTLPAEPARIRLGPLPRFVRLRGGGYFFLPSLRALGYVAEGGPEQGR